LVCKFLNFCTYKISSGLRKGRATKFIFALSSEISTASPELASPQLALIPEVCASNQIWILTIWVQIFLEFCVLRRKIETKPFLSSSGICSTVDSTFSFLVLM